MLLQSLNKKNSFLKIPHSFTYPKKKPSPLSTKMSPYCDDILIDKMFKALITHAS